MLIVLINFNPLIQVGTKLQKIVYILKHFGTVQTKVKASHYNVIEYFFINVKNVLKSQRIYI